MHEHVRTNIEQGLLPTCAGWTGNKEKPEEKSHFAFVGPEDMMEAFEKSYPGVHVRSLVQFPPAPCSSGAPTFACNPLG